MVSRFLLTTFLLKNLDEASFGEYAVFSSSISFFSLFLGFEYFNLTARDYLDSKKNKFSVFNEQFGFYVSSYLILLPLFFTLFLFGKINIELAAFFYILLILDHLSQEIIRILQYLEKQVIASVLFFIKSSAWFFLLFFFIKFDSFELELSTVFTVWICGSLVSLVVGFIFLRKEISFGELTFSFSREVLFKQIRGASPFLIAVLSQSGIVTFDKYALDYFEGPEVVGICAFYLSMSMVIITAIESAVTSIYFPSLMKFYNDSNFNEYFKVKNRMLFGILILLFIGVPTLYFGIDIVLVFLNKKGHLDYKSVFLFYLIGVVFQSLSMLPHYQLYAQKRDRQIVVSTFLSFIITLLLYLILGRFYGAIGIAISTMIGMVLIFSLKQVFVFQKRIVV